MRVGLSANKLAYRSAFGQTKSYWQARMDKDLYDLASKINAKVADATIRARGTAVMNAISSVVLHERHVSQQAGSHGITIYGPVAKNKKADFAYYRTLDLSAHTRRDESWLLSCRSPSAIRRLRSEPSSTSAAFG